MNRLYVVGIGPGGRSNMTLEAVEVLEQCAVIIGYTAYVDLVRPHFTGKQYIVTGMKLEMERCETALKTAAAGKTAALVCSGDAGIYGMAGILLEMSVSYPTVEIEIVAGVTAATSGAAVLGAPLGHDFAVISLSDLLTPWERIAKRLRCAAMSDFAICLYNPSSKKRINHLRLACTEILKYQSPETVCGYVRNIAREGEYSRILTLSELADTNVDMFTTVFIGNSMTRRINDQMVTPRGYRLRGDKTKNDRK